MKLTIKELNGCYFGNSSTFDLQSGEELGGYFIIDEEGNWHDVADLIADGVEFEVHP